MAKHTSRTKSPFTEQIVQEIVDDVGPVKQWNGGTEKLDPRSLKAALDRAFDWYDEMDEIVRVVLELASHRKRAKSICKQLVSASQQWANVPATTRRVFERCEDPLHRCPSLDRRLVAAADDIEQFLAGYRKHGNQNKYAVMPLQEFTFIVSGYWEAHVAEPFSWAYKTGHRSEEPVAPALKLIWGCAPYLNDHLTMKQCANAIKHVRRFWSPPDDST